MISFIKEKNKKWKACILKIVAIFVATMYSDLFVFPSNYVYAQACASMLVPKVLSTPFVTLPWHATSTQLYDYSAFFDASIAGTCAV